MGQFAILHAYRDVFVEISENSCIIAKFLSFWLCCVVGHAPGIILWLLLHFVVPLGNFSSNTMAVHDNNADGNDFIEYRYIKQAY